MTTIESIEAEYRALMASIEQEYRDVVGVAAAETREPVCVSAEAPRQPEAPTLPPSASSRPPSDLTSLLQNGASNTYVDAQSRQQVHHWIGLQNEAALEAAHNALLQQQLGNEQGRIFQLMHPRKPVAPTAIFGPDYYFDATTSCLHVLDENPLPIGNGGTARATAIGTRVSGGNKSKRFTR